MVLENGADPFRIERLTARDESAHGAERAGNLGRQLAEQGRREKHRGNPLLADFARKIARRERAMSEEIPRNWPPFKRAPQISNVTASKEMFDTCAIRSVASNWM